MLQKQVSKEDLDNIIAFSKIEHLPSLYDGLFRVARDGRVYRRKGGGYVLAAQCKAGKNGDHLLTNAYVDGKTKSFQVRQLVALAHIPNPDNKPHVLCKDGNGLNNHADNLYWATPKELTELIYKEGKMRTKANSSVPCITCAEPTLCKDRICTRCKIKARAREKNSQREKVFVEAVNKQISEIDIGEISPRNIDIISQYAEGKTLQAIGDEYSLTRERVRQIIFSYLRLGKNGGVITERQKQLAAYITEIGINRTRLSVVANIGYQHLGKMLNLKACMPEKVYERLCDITGFKGEVFEGERK